MNRGDDKALSLGELARMIEEVITDNFDRAYWVKAEMARLNLYPESGHCFPDLVEKEDRTIKAQMRGTIWAGNYQRIARRFLEVTREPLHDGLQILFLASVKFHPQYGFSLQIADIDPTYTLGQMTRERLETINRLKKEGVFDQNRSLSFPVLPKRIAVISVQTSKGYSDFMKILLDQASDFHFQVLLFPAMLQGDKAVESILGQLAAIRRLKDHFDLAAIIRGGGGDIGLSCYDDYSLAREVAVFPIPVITGIGHSTNETVVEMVAASNRITPTDVAYSLVDRFRELDVRLKEISQVLSSYCTEILEDSKTMIKILAARLQTETLHRMEAEHHGMETMLRNTLHQSRMRLGVEQQRLTSAMTILRLGPARMLSLAGNTIRHRRYMMSTHLTTYSIKEKAKLKLAETNIHMLDPRNTLKRGYSITRINGKPVLSATEVSSGDVITTELYCGNISSTINDKDV